MRKIEAKKRLLELTRKYNLSSRDVMLAHLIAANLPMGDAFDAIYRSSASDKELACRRYLAGNPKVDVLVNALRDGSADRDAADAVRPKLDNIDLRTKDGVLTALEAELKNADDTKQRTDIIGKIADLQRMKNEEDKENRKLIHYYLPLRCEECPYKEKVDQLLRKNDNILD